MSSDWPLVRLGDLITLKGGFAYKGEHLGSGEVKLLGMGVVSHSERFLKNGIRSYCGEFPESSRVNPGDIVIATRQQSDNLPILGCPGLVPNELADADIVVGTNLYKVTNASDVDNKFLYWLLRGTDYRNRILECSKGTTVRMITKDSVEDFKFSCPPQPVRNEISKFLDVLDDRISLLRETNATLEAIAQVLFKSWFVDFDPVRAKMEGRVPEGMDEATAALFPDSFEETELGEVPRGWRVMSFLAACDLQGGAQPPASTFVDSPRDGYVRLLQIRDFSTDAHKTYIPDTSKLKKAMEDDVLLGRYGSASGDKAKDSLGRVCRGLSGAYNVALMKLVPIQVGREFALQLVNDPRFYNYLQGVSSKAVQSGFSKSELGQYKVVVPSQELCDVFEAIGLAFWERLKHGVARQREMAELRDTLLPRLISGQLRLSELLETEVA